MLIVCMCLGILGEEGLSYVIENVCIHTYAHNSDDHYMRLVATKLPDYDESAEDYINIELLMITA